MKQRIKKHLVFLIIILVILIIYWVFLLLDKLYKRPLNKDFVDHRKMCSEWFFLRDTSTVKDWDKCECVERGFDNCRTIWCPEGCIYYN